MPKIRNVAIVSVQFLDVDAVAYDPDEVTLWYRAPAGGVTSVAYTDGTNGVTRSATGAYHYDLYLSTAGTYHAGFIGGPEGDFAAADEVTIEVTRSRYDS